MAESGRGSYFFLRESIIRRTIEDALSSLQRTVGVGASIHVQSVAPHGELSRIFRPLETEADPDTPLLPVADDSEIEEAVDTSPRAEPAQAAVGTVWVGDLQVGGHKQQLVEAYLKMPHHMPDGEEVTLLRYELRFQCPSSGQEMRVPGIVTIFVGSSGTRSPQVQVADVMQQLEPRQEEFTRLMEEGSRDEALTLQRQVIQELEVVQELDTRGYAFAHIRRLRRVLQRVEDNAISTTQARLMVGETLQRSNSGDLARLHSPPGTPTMPSLHPQLDFSLESPRSSPPMLYRNITPPSSPPMLYRNITPPSSPPMLYRNIADIDVVDVGPSTAPLPSAPARLLADGCDRTSLPSELFCPITHEVMTDPVVAADGHTYERAAIQRWFLEGGRTSPKTGGQMSGTGLIPNHAIRAQIMTENERQAVTAGRPHQKHECSVQ